MMGVESGEGAEPLPCIIKFKKMKNTCISTESKTLYPHEKCRTYVNKTIFARHNNYGPLYFLLVSISFRCPSKP